MSHDNMGERKKALTTKRSKSKRIPSVFCISHRKDIDGISSAALVKSFTNAEVVLVDYTDLTDALERIKDCRELYICDLGLNEKIVPEFLTEVRRLIREGTSISYIDHHPINSEVMQHLLHAGVDCVHSLNECTGVQIYLKFQDSLRPNMKALACYAAITDYMDSQPVAKRLIQGFDRQFLLLESSIVAYAAALKGNQMDYLLYLTDELSKGKIPHQIPTVFENAKKQADKVLKVMDYVKSHGKAMKKMAYVQTDEFSTGNVANFVIGVFSKPVGVSFKEDRKGNYEISLRGNDESKTHLGRLVGELAEKFGGAGGGHAKASGATIPKEHIEEFLSELDSKLD
jgi:single-stranded DNA-specific DHH superfamily exonuclease